MVKLAIALALVAGAVSACTLLDDDPPDDSCKLDSDCFRAQGELCNAKKRCEVRVFMDAGVDAP